MATRRKTGREGTNFATIAQRDLPNGRKGKHHLMLRYVLEDLRQLEHGRAIKIPLADFSGSVADIRSAIHRATRKQKLEIATSSDDEYFYLWKSGPDGNGQ